MGSSDDDISLREHMQRQLDVIREGAQIRLAGLEKHTDDEIQHVKDYFDRLLKESRIQLDERYHNQDKALQAALATQEKAVQAALIAVEKSVTKDIVEVGNAIRSSRRETDLAYQASQTAIEKSEQSINQRLYLLNEFQAKAADQNHRFAQRETVDTRMVEFEKRLDVVKSDLLPRETFDSTVAAWVEWRRQVDASLNEHRGGAHITDRARETALRWQIAFAGFFVTAVVVIANIVTNQ